MNTTTMTRMVQPGSRTADAVKRLLKRCMPEALLAMRSHLLTRRLDGSFAKLGNSEAFGKIYRDQVWGNGDDEFCSGLGSRDPGAVTPYAQAIRTFLARHERKLDVVDVGCGDFSVGSEIRNACDRYVGCDVVPDLIRRNALRYAALDVTFMALDATRDPLPAGDLCFVRQVLQHLSNAQISEILPKLCQFRHLIITENIPAGRFTANLDKQMGPATRITGFKPSGVVLSDPPFNLKARRKETLLRVEDGFGGVIETTYYFEPCLGDAKAPAVSLVATGESAVIRQRIDAFPGGEKVAVVHDWLNSYVGGERVLEQIIAVAPASQLFVTFDNMEASDRAFLHGKVPHTSFLQNWSFVRKHYTKFLPLLTLAVEQLDMAGYDIVLSSSASIGKGVITSADQMHVAYVHSPMRYAWDMQHQYLSDFGLTHGLKGFAARSILHHARMWDLRAANGVDHFIANSHYIARRIWRVYRREADVVYPPVDIDAFGLREDKDSFYLAASRLVPYKRMDAIVEAFSLMPSRKLVVVGAGPEMARLKAAAGPNVEIVGYQPHHVLLDYMQRARAFVFAAEEDFGITPVEAQACGTPVIAFGRGGATETIRGLDAAEPTGVFFNEQAPEQIAEAVEQFERNAHRIQPLACRANAERFSVDEFQRNYVLKVRELWDKFDRQH